MRSFLDRFVHPWVAAVAAAGVVVWLASFLVAATGLAIRSVDAAFAIDLFFASGLLGLFGMAVLAGCGVWLVGVRASRLLRGSRG